MTGSGIIFGFGIAAMLLFSVFGVLLWLSGWPSMPDSGTSPILDLSVPDQTENNASGGLKVLSYNMHYGVGRPDDFLERCPKKKVEETLDGIAAILRKQSADIVLLQEVDFDSDRTYNIDQLKWIAEKAGYRHAAPVTTWHKRWMPWPYKKPYGKMLSGQAVLSRIPIKSNRYKRLPKPDANSFIYNLFYLDRTLQHVQIDISGKTLNVFNVHTEAYDLENRQLHAEMIVEELKDSGLSGYVILAGDFNAIPPEAKIRHGFADEPDQDMRKDRSIETIRSLNLGEIINQEKYLSDEQAALTFPADTPSRRLDYLFFSGSLTLQDGGILHEAATLSDHLPTWADFIASDAITNRIK